MGLDVSFGTGASQDHPVGSPQLTIPTGQSHISQLFLISQVFKGGEVKVFSDILMLEKSEVNVFRIVKCLVTEGNGSSAGGWMDGCALRSMGLTPL